MARTAKRNRAEDYAAKAIAEFQSETAEITEAADPRTLRATTFVLVAMVVTAFVLMYTLPLERVVVASGRIVSESPTILVQPLEASIVRGIHVRPGQRVKKGDLLATLDPTFSGADLAAFRKDTERLEAEIARLEAEWDERAFVARDGSPYWTLQMSIWKARQAEYKSAMSRSQQLIDSAELTIARATEDVKHFRTRLRLASSVEEMRKDLERSQVGSRLNSLIAEDGRVEMARNLAEAEGLIRAANNDLEVQKAERELFVQKWKGEIVKSLLDRRSEYETVQEQLAKAERRWEMVDLRAVEDAVVLDVGTFSAGSVVRQADKLVTLVPLEGNYYAEVDIDAADQGFVQPGQTVKIKFAAYPFIKHGAGEGIVRTISADSFSRTEDDRDIRKTRLPERFYRARIDVVDLPLRYVPDEFRLMPGMPLDADIVVGERTPLSYLLEGAMRSTAEGLREP